MIVRLLILIGLACRYLPQIAVAKCSISGQHVKIEQLEKNFPDAIQKLEKTLSLRMRHRLEWVSDSRSLEAEMGCSIARDLWTDQFFVNTYHAAGQPNREARVSLRTIPDGCLQFRRPEILKTGTQIFVTTYLNPVSDDQMQRTKEWLAERGYSTGRLMARNVTRAIDAEKEWKQECQVVHEKP